jgi:hypothetical protein
MTKKSKLLALVLVLVLVFVFSSVSFANNLENQNLLEDQDLFTQAINNLEQYVSRMPDGTFFLDPPEEVISEIQPDIYKSIISGMEFINQEIEAGRLVSTENLTVYNPEDENFSLQGGVNKVVFYWWGFKVYLNHTACKNLTSIFNGGAASSAIASGAAQLVKYISKLGPWAAIIAGILWLDATILNHFDDGNGVVMRFNYNPITKIVITGIWAQ